MKLRLTYGWLALLGSILHLAAAGSFTWPAESRITRPWAYWWWMGSAVDETNIVRELNRYHIAGMGGVHIIPIYGAIGWEDRYIPYLSPRWMEMLDFTVRQAAKLDLGVDMTTGSGWCFGGPKVTDEEANASVVCKTYSVAAGAKLEEKFNPKSLQALMAFANDGRHVDLMPKLSAEGLVDWQADNGAWKVYAISQKPSGQKVKRAGPGGQGNMLNLFYGPAMEDYLRWFDTAFHNYRGAKPRSQYHDSYEYRCDWSPDFFAQFQRRRHYRLQDELPALFGQGDPDRIARVKCDYRETASDLMAEATLPQWVQWSHRNGFLTRNEAHGSPGNWLDLYAVADIPETEMFHEDRNKLVSKFASSAAHVAGHPLASAETGTWLKEHFTETLADMKYLLDDMFLSGINHVFYHGTCYSPDEAGWPGWLFYASYEMNPRNPIWRDVPALNRYASRCQAVLQAGKPDNDILLYWPIHDLWHNPSGMIRNLTVHARDWFEDQPIGRMAGDLWARGFAFDYISDRQLAASSASKASVQAPGGTYRAVVIPPCEHMPLETFEQLLNLARGGGWVIFAERLPTNVPGLDDSQARREQLKKLAGGIQPDSNGVAKVGRGYVFVGDVPAGLAKAGIQRERLFDNPGLMCIRRVVKDGYFYFIANRSTNAVEGWTALARPAREVVMCDPLTGQTGAAAQRASPTGPEVRLALQPGASMILRTFTGGGPGSPPWNYWQPAGTPHELSGEWRVEFLAAGPAVPPAYETDRLGSWADSTNSAVQAFAGTARYTLRFDVPADGGREWRLDLGKVCQSARIRLNGNDLGVLITPPFQVLTGPLRPRDNLLEVEVTSVAANRVRDLDRRGVKWKTFHDANFVNLNYRPFDASNWPVTSAGLLGPVTLTPVADTAH
jgi:hypothetical protein